MTRDPSFDVAVTGVAFRLPGESDPDAWWRATLAGQVLTTRLDRDELLRAGVTADLVDADDYVPARGVLADADRFDHRLFGISARDAELMDPQHRLMLEVAWAALEDAGCPPQAAEDDEGRSVAVYASGSGSGYLRAMLTGGPLDPQTLDQALHGTEPDFIASLVSYKLGLTGPALGVQTACSSSLVAVHLAVQALQNAECDMALVVGAGIDFPQAGHLAVVGGIQSASGACRPFDAEADGVVAGSGVVAVVLRRLADLDDDPEPYGVLLGTAINNDGSAKAGYYAPSQAGQEEVIQAALTAAGVDGSSIGYLEAHATGTRIGDPIEWAAATAALKATGAAPGQVAVGALKGSIGHLDAASGLVALVKAMRVVKEGIVPPVAGFTALNPLLDADGSPLRVPTGAEQWRGPEPRRAGISSFGIGGTNAHVIVEAPAGASVPEVAGDRERAVLLSAADPEALSRLAEQLADHLRRHEPDLADVATTAHEGRATLGERLVVVGRDSTEVAERLANDEVVRGHAPVNGPAAVVFLLPGQGAQYPGMAASFAGLPGFDTALDECLTAFPADLAARLGRALSDPDFPAAELSSTELTQPALFAVGWAVGRALMDLGVTPDALAGHSLGEITAACLAGALDLPDAARLIAVRGRAMQACPPGAMLALACDAATAQKWIAETGTGVTLAAVNGPENCTVSGPAADIEELAARVGDRFFVRRLRTSHAFHSPMIEPAVAELAGALDGVALRPLTLPLASNLTGEIRPAGSTVTPESLIEQARQPVLFAPALARLAEKHAHCVGVEAGPGRGLSVLAEAAGLDAVPLDARAEAPAKALTALGRLWTLGVAVPPEHLGVLDGRPIHLPAYPFAGPKLLAPEVTRVATPAPAPDEPAPDEPAQEPVPERPSEEPAAVVRRLWGEVLGHHDDLADDADFFALGGDSLLITQLARRLKDELDVRVPLREMLAGRTLGRQTGLVLAAIDPITTP